MPKTRPILDLCNNFTEISRKVHDKGEKFINIYDTWVNNYIEQIRLIRY